MTVNEFVDANCGTRIIQNECLSFNSRDAIGLNFGAIPWILAR